MEQMDAFLQDLQDRIVKETEQEFGAEATRRWQNPTHFGAMDLADARARLTGSCGDSIEIFLQVEDNRVKKASFVSDGCGPSVVCGDLACELAEGKDPEDAASVTGGLILEKIGGLPEENEHCAFLAAGTLQEAVGNYVRGVKRK
ncbi:MAG: iron-sulfur cluster assembly scaffold protein [Desulfonatronovibrionaceae bacterium]